MKKVVLKLDYHDEKVKQKAMQKVSGLVGVDSVEMDMKDKKMTVKGEIDPVEMVAKLRKICHAEIVSVGPDKEPEKKKEEPKVQVNKMAYYPNIYQHPQAYQYQPPHYMQQHPSYYKSADEDPNSCVIC